MELNKLKILENIGKVYEDSKNCKLDKEFFTKIDVELSYLSTYFKTTKSQAFFISVVFALNYKGDTVDLNDLINYFDCNPMKILEYSEDFKYLHSANIFMKQKSNHRIKLAAVNDQFTINIKLSEAILDNRPMPKMDDTTVGDVYDLLEKLDDLVEQRYDEELSSPQLFIKFRKLCNSNLHFPFIEKLNSLNLNREDQLLYALIVWKTLSGDRKIDANSTLERIYSKSTNRVKCLQALVNGTNKLVQQNLLELETSTFLNDTELVISDYSADMLKEIGFNLKNNKTKSESCLDFEDIPEKKLIFGEKENTQISTLQQLLIPKKLHETQNRLTKKNLPKGITILLHGFPGTGKTELVKQLAKNTGRKIMKVEISQSKSMWFGESEKIIKKIFNDYKRFSNECKEIPILLFNEADAVLSKRMDVGNSGVSKTENAIQNILLEEFENFDGILMATTNLTNNLDHAFERRFLFKIKFDKPEMKTRAKIWKTKLPMLSLQQCETIASTYDFTGGQIENIVRKAEIHEIVNGDKVDFESVLGFCASESMHDAKVKIGF
jgi:AAA+ superfamily predicted ATPase